MKVAKGRDVTKEENHGDDGSNGVGGSEGYKEDQWVLTVWKQRKKGLATPLKGGGRRLSRKQQDQESTDELWAFSSLTSEGRH